MRPFLAIATAAALAACNSGADDSMDPTQPSIQEPADSADPAAGTRPADQPRLVTVEGRIGEGAECPLLTMPDGGRWSLSMEGSDFGPGDYVELTGERMDASICMAGEGTLLVRRIDPIDPPARDRDPARAGGLAVTSDYVRGSWVAKGLNADCDRPDFQIMQNRNGGSIIETSVNGVPTTGYVDVGESPAFQWDEGLPALPIETRGPDGLAVMPGDGRTVTLAGHRIAGDGVVFVRCA
ncbi:DUF5818 domain-containing protein [Aurantiacibacter spongiae]|uniref:Uncharacterized protein n=1 Tax=Aurantiacibacter spongiae TaxID=2488860 RepID=A0A3N5DG06_9SPHN|nr:DUF5818 domain-containing protein [Aurantiacibacter spongiae]RPF70602.1 hypothetical protein EG799_02400 [Aurantiacibacter spongiae]